MTKGASDEKRKKKKKKRRKAKGEETKNDKRALARIRGSKHKRVRDGVRSGMTLFATSLAIAASSRMRPRASRGAESGF